MSAWVQATTLLLLASGLYAADDLIAFFPKEIRPGASLPISAGLLEVAAGVANPSCLVKIMKGKEIGWSDAMVRLVFAPPNQMDAYGMIDVPESVNGDYYISISCTNVNVSTMTKTLSVVQQQPGIFIQTDKVIYKAGDTVRIRALVVKPNLNPSYGRIDLTLKDPKDNAVFTQTTNATAIQPGEFQLSEDAQEGQWSIKVQTTEGDKTAYFTVKEYVLPRFDLKLNVKQVGQALDISVEAKYTFGKHVPGILKVKINSVLQVENYDYGAGVAKFQLPFSQLDLTRQGPTTLMVFATLSEDYTDTEMNATESIQVIVSSVDFAVAVVQPAPFLSTLQTVYSFQVRVTNTLGDEAAPGQLGDYSIHWETLPTMNQLTGSLTVTENPTTVTIDLMTGGTNTYMYSIKVWITRNREKSVEVTHTPERYESISGAAITLEKVSSTIKDNACYKIPEYDQKSPAFCQVITDTASPLQRYNQVTGHCFTVTSEHKPSCMVICYMIVPVKDYRDLLTASAKYDFQWNTRNQVTTSIMPNTVRPGSDVRLTVQASSQSFVGLSAVDASTKILAGGKENMIKASQVLQFANKNRLFSSPEPQYNPGEPMPLGGRMMIADCFGCWSGGVYPIDILTGAGLEFLSEKVEVQRHYNYFDDNLMFANELPEVAAAAPEMDDGGNRKPAADKTNANLASEAPVEKRTEFPETWLFSIEETNSAGLATLDLKVPDTITNWTVDAFALSQTDGLGVADTTTVTVFKEFFLVMNLPYSVVRTEGFDLEILVFNYLNDDLTVNVKLDATDEIRVKGNLETVITIGGLSNGVVKIPITAVKIGDVLLKVEVNALNINIPGDRVEKTLKVKAEGREIEAFHELRVDVAVNDLVSFNLTKLFKSPPYSPYTFVRGSLRMYLKVTGNLMGSFIAGLYKRVVFPYGCGEQNLISFTPTVFIMKYLKAIGKDDPSIRKLASKICATGYSRQLNYQHSNYSLSAFGESTSWGVGSQHKTYGSTWLSAYVLRIFAELSQLGLSHVDVSMMDNIFGFINAMTTDSIAETMFLEYGRVIHTKMQGGTSSGIGFSAFCLISVIKYREALRTQTNPNATAELAADNLIRTGTTWLRGKDADLTETEDPYLFAISSYALALGVSTSGDNTYSTAKAYMAKYELAKNKQPAAILQCPSTSFGRRPVCFEKEGIKSSLCQNPCPTGEVCCDNPCATGRRCIKGVLPSPLDGSSEIEMQGYALMAYAKLYEKATSTTDRDLFRKKAMLARNFLIDHRTNGFFKSTQDTAIALQALSVFAMVFPESRTPDFTVHATSAGKKVTDQVTVNEDNAMLLLNKKIEVSADAIPGDLALVINGNAGTLYVTVQAIYNLMDNSSSRSLNISVTTKKTRGGYEITPCFWANPNKSPSSMVIIRMAMPSGLDFDEAESENVQKTEFESVSKTLNLYYQDDKEDGFQTRKCARISTTVDVEITNMQPARVMAMNYYDTDDSAEVPYALLDNQVPTIGAMGLMTNVFLLVLSSLMAHLIVTM